MKEAQAEVDAARSKRAELYAKVEEIQQNLQKDYVEQNTAKMNPKLPSKESFSPSKKED